MLGKRQMILSVIVSSSPISGSSTAPSYRIIRAGDCVSSMLLNALMTDNVELFIV